MRHFNDLAGQLVNKWDCSTKNGTVGWFEACASAGLRQLRNESALLTQTVISYIQICDVSDTDEQVVRKRGDPTSNALTASVKHT